MHAEATVGYTYQIEREVQKDAVEDDEYYYDQSLII